MTVFTAEGRGGEARNLTPLSLLPVNYTVTKRLIGSCEFRPIYLRPMSVLCSFLLVASFNLIKKVE